MSDHVPRIQVVQGDITQVPAQAIVTAANEGLKGGGGVDGAVHRAAGPKLLEACRKVAPCPTGQSRITPAFDLDASYVIHTVGPVYRDGRSGEREQLESAYRSALELAEEKQIDSIAFPCISTGVYGFPPEEAADVAVEVVSHWIGEHDLPTMVHFCCFGDDDYQRYERRVSELEQGGQ